MRWQRPEAWPSHPQGHCCVAFLPLTRVQLKCLRPKPFVRDPQTIGEHIRKRRHELRLTQKQAAQMLGVNAWTVLNWELGKRTPLIPKLRRVFDFLGYDPFPPPTTVADRLRQERRRRGWSAREAAGHIGVDRCTWTAWEAGGIVVRPMHRTRLAQFLGIEAVAFQVTMRARWNAKHPRQRSDKSCVSSVRKAILQLDLYARLDR